MSISNPAEHFIFTWIIWAITLNFALVFIVRPKFLFSPRKRATMQTEKSKLIKLAFFFMLFISALALGSSSYFLRLNNAQLELPIPH